MILLSVERLRKVYGHDAKATEAIRDLTFAVEEGEFVCVIGPSGCGKTTLLRCLAGLLAPTSGFIALREELVEQPPEEMALVFQDYNRSLFPWMTVRHNVAFPLRGKHLGRTESARRADEAIAAVGLTRFVDHHPWQLSGGMQQRVAIARALAYRPTVLLMDEPFASVDAQARCDLEDLTLGLAGRLGVTVVFVTHYIDDSIYLADRIVVLTAAPARVNAILSFSLPRPRDQLTTKATPEFSERRSEVRALLERSP